MIRIPPAKSHVIPKRLKSASHLPDSIPNTNLMKLPIVRVVLTSLLLTSALFAQTPQLLNYQGRVAVGNVNFDGTGRFKFALVDGGVNQSTQASAFAVVLGGIGPLEFILVVNGGSGYTTAPEVTITDATGPGTGATVEAIVANGVVTGIQITNAGADYLDPVVTIAPPSPNIVTTSFWNNDGTSVGPADEPTGVVELPVTKGLYSVLLGDTAVPNMAVINPASGVFNRADLRLRVWFNDDANGFQLLSPDQRLAPTAYLADGAVNSTSIADGAISASKVANGAITANAILGGAINVSHLGVPASPTPGQVLGYDGTDIAWVAPGGGGGGGGIWTLNGTNDAYYSGGKVGIGTANPTHRLTLAGGPAWTSNGWTGTLALPNATAIGWGTNAAGQNFGMGHTNTGFCFFRTANTPGTTGSPALYDMFISDAGNVGIGTGATPPTAKLAVSGTAQPGLSVNADWVPNQHANVDLTGERPTVKWSAPTGTFPIFSTRSWIAHLGATRGLEFWTRSERNSFPFSDTGWLSRITLTTEGNIDYVGKLGKLDTNEQFSSTVRAADFFLGHSTRRGTPGRALVDNAGALVINFAGDWAETHIGGAVTQVNTLRITGGADLAEPFQMKEEELEKGSVVVIDDEHPGRLKRSSGAYDTRVAGIVSGANGVNPGIALHQEGVIEGGQNVSLSGRVYVQADATGASIKPGDLLTTSDTPGHAMKVTEHGRSQGAVIGKAMSSLKEGKGMVLVLVTLQ